MEGLVWIDEALLVFGAGQWEMEALALEEQQVMVWVFGWVVGGGRVMTGRKDMRLRTRDKQKMRDTRATGDVANSRFFSLTPLNSPHSSFDLMKVLRL